MQGCCTRDVAKVPSAASNESPVALPVSRSRFLPCHLRCLRREIRPNRQKDSGLGIREICWTRGTAGPQTAADPGRRARVPAPAALFALANIFFTRPQMRTSECKISPHFYICFIYVSFLSFLPLIIITNTINSISSTVISYKSYSLKKSARVT